MTIFTVLLAVLAVVVSVGSIYYVRLNERKWREQYAREEEEEIHHYHVFTTEEIDRFFDYLRSDE